MEPNVGLGDEQGKGRRSQDPAGLAGFKRDPPIQRAASSSVEELAARYLSEPYEARSNDRVILLSHLKAIARRLEPDVRGFQRYLDVDLVKLEAFRDKLIKVYDDLNDLYVVEGSLYGRVDPDEAQLVASTIELVIQQYYYQSAHIVKLYLEHLDKKSLSPPDVLYVMEEFVKRVSAFYNALSEAGKSLLGTSR